MNPLILLVIGCSSAAIITLMEPFWVLPVFIFGNFVEPVQYFPQLKEYSPAATLGGVIIVSWVIHLVVFRDFVPAKSSHVTATYLFMIWAVFSSLVNGETSWKALMLHSRALIPYFLFLYMVKTRKQVKIILWTLLIFGAIAGIYGLYCAEMNIGLSDRGTKRIMSFFSNPNMFGEISTLLVPLAVALLFNQYPKKVKMILLLIIGILIMGVVLSFSRKCFFALIPAIFLTTTKCYSAGKKVVAIIMTIFFLVGAFYFMPMGPKYRYWARVSTVLEADSAGQLDHGRTETAKAAWKMMLQHPAFGVGLGGFKHEYKMIAQISSDIDLVGSKIMDSEAAVVHNVILEAGSMLGLVGLALYVVLVVLAFKDSREAERRFASRKDDFLRIAAIYLQVFIFAAMIVGQFTPFLTSRIFWMVLPLSARLRTLSLEQHSKGGEAFGTSQQVC